MSISTRIVPIGNSQGVRIPRALLEQSGIGGEVTLTVEENRIVISPAHRPREGWEEAFKRMAQAGDDQLLDSEVNNAFDTEEWEWE